MGLFDQIGGALKGAVASELAANGPALLNAALAKTNMGNLQGVVDQLQQGGLGDQVRSWLSDGPNMKVSPEQIQSALGSDQLQQLAAHFGIPIDAVSKLLAEHLPKAMDSSESGRHHSQFLIALPLDETNAGPCGGPHWLTGTLQSMPTREAPVVLAAVARASLWKRTAGSDPCQSRRLPTRQHNGPKAEDWHVGLGVKSGPGASTLLTSSWDQERT